MSYDKVALERYWITDLQSCTTELRGPTPLRIEGIWVLVMSEYHSFRHFSTRFSIPSDLTKYKIWTGNKKTRREDTESNIYTVEWETLKEWKSIFL